MNNYTNILHSICLIYTMHMSKNQGTRSNTSLENKYRPVSQRIFFFENSLI